MQIGWLMAALVAVLVGGLLTGIAGLLLWPLVAAVAAVVFFVWMGKRKTEGKPPMR